MPTTVNPPLPTDSNMVSNSASPFVGTPSRVQIMQGNLNDCLLLGPLAALCALGYASIVEAGLAAASAELWSITATGAINTGDPIIVNMDQKYSTNGATIPADGAYWMKLYERWWTYYKNVTGAAGVNPFDVVFGLCERTPNDARIYSGSDAADLVSGVRDALTAGDIVLFITTASIPSNSPGTTAPASHCIYALPIAQQIYSGAIAFGNPWASTYLHILTGDNLLAGADNGVFLIYANPNTVTDPNATLHSSSTDNAKGGGLVSVGSVSVAGPLVLNATAYQVKRGATVLSNSRFATETGLSGGAYQYTFVAMNAASMITNTSWAWSVSNPGDAPPAPINLTGFQLPNGSAGITWSAADRADSYTVLVDGNAVAQVTATQYNFQPLPGSADYVITVTATNSSGTSSASSPLTLTLGANVSILQFAIGAAPVTVFNNVDGQAFPLTWLGTTLCTCDTVLNGLGKLKAINTTTGALTDIEVLKDISNAPLGGCIGLASHPLGILVIDSANNVITLNSLSTGSVLGAGQAYWNSPTSAAGGFGSSGGIAYDSSTAKIIEVEQVGTGDEAAVYSTPALTINGGTPVADSVNSLWGTNVATGATSNNAGTYYIADLTTAAGVLRSYGTSWGAGTLGAGTLTGMGAIQVGAVASQPSNGSLWTMDIGSGGGAIKVRQFWRTDGVQAMPAGTVWHGGATNGTITFSGGGTITSDLAVMDLTNGTIISRNGVLKIIKGTNAVTRTGTSFFVGPGGTIQFVGFTDNPTVSSLPTNSAPVWML